MKKINILTKSIYNKIAAGEVVDRPYSVVKELVENSLDAEATEIEIHIEHGGKQLIKVIDNGTGIDREDMRAAFFPHATSKITKASDLNKIRTMGFRGEALASIAAVSRVELTSVTEGSTACKVTCVDSEIGPVEPAALEKGTEICVRDIFYNVPARASYLREDRKEESDITNIVTRFILGRPNVSFRYYTDGKLALQSNGDGLEEAIVRVYGTDILSKCYKIDVERDGIRVYGYVSNQNFFKPNKTYQSLFVNGRYIINNSISVAIAQGYSHYTMKRQYPFYVLNLEIPYKYVDVNVHPNKMDVRMVVAHAVFVLLCDVLTNVLDGTAKAAEFVVGGQYSPEVKSTKPEKLYKDEPENVKAQPLTYMFTQTNDDYRDNEPQKEVKYYDPVIEEPFNSIFEIAPYQTAHVSKDVSENSHDKTAEEIAERRQYEQQKIEFESCKFKGNLFNTYLLYEIEDKVYIIDQHAAHERLLFDRLCEKAKNKAVNKQYLFSSYLLPVSPQEKEFIIENVVQLVNLGFAIEMFSTNAFRIDAVPSDLRNMDIKKFFDEILADIDEFKKIKAEDVFREKLAMTACKHAVRGGMELTPAEVETLFKLLKGNMGLKCPHGRPICVVLSKKELEKMFKRIV